MWAPLPAVGYSVSGRSSRSDLDCCSEWRNLVGQQSIPTQAGNRVELRNYHPSTSTFASASARSRGYVSTSRAFAPEHGQKC